MKLKDLIESTSLRAVGLTVGLDVQMVGGKLECKALDPDDPRYSMDFILPSMRMVEACRADDFDLFQPWIDSGKLTVEQMHRAAARYHMGKTRSGVPMFWMIDEMMDPQDAHIGTFDKLSTGTEASWLSTLLKAREPLLGYWPFKHCFFGQHLLMEGCDVLPVALVENEASAVVLSELFPEALWMAYVDVTWLDVERFAPLAGRTVTIYPRTDPYMSNFLFFDELAATVQRYCNIRISVASILEDYASEEQKTRCIDLLDFLREAVTVRRGS